MQPIVIKTPAMAAVKSPQPGASKSPPKLALHGDKIADSRDLSTTVAFLPLSRTDLHRGRRYDSGVRAMAAAGCIVGADPVFCMARVAISAATGRQTTGAGDDNSWTIEDVKNVLRIPTRSKEIPFISARIDSGSATHA